MPDASIVGTWDPTLVDWDCTGNPSNVQFTTFHADGTWQGQMASGRWIQVGGMAIFTPDQAPGLIYVVNVTPYALSGIMAFISDPLKGTGCFYATRQDIPKVPAPNRNAITGPES